MALFGGDSTALTQQTTNVEEKAIQADDNAGVIVQAQGDVNVTDAGIVDNALDFLSDALDTTQESFSGALAQVGTTSAQISEAARGGQAKSFDKLVMVLGAAAVAVAAIFVFGGKARA